MSSDSDISSHRGSQPTEDRWRAVARHIAAHLQALMLLTLRYAALQENDGTSVDNDLKSDSVDVDDASSNSKGNDLVNLSDTNSRADVTINAMNDEDDAEDAVDLDDNFMEDDIPIPDTDFDLNDIPRQYDGLVAENDAFLKKIIESGAYQSWRDEDEESAESTDANEAKLDPQNTPTPEDLLLDAVWEGDVKAVAMCIRQAPPSSCGAHGLTPLHLAVKRDHTAVAMYLLDHGADVHACADGGCMPLHLAARYASAAMVEMLINRGKADPNSQTMDGRTALHYAAKSAEDGNKERQDVIRLLGNLGANPTLRNKKDELPRDVALKIDYWDAAAILGGAEQQWEAAAKAAET